MIFSTRHKTSSLSQKSAAGSTLVADAAFSEGTLFFFSPFSGFALLYVRFDVFFLWGPAFGRGVFDLSFRFCLCVQHFFDNARDRSFLRVCFPRPPLAPPFPKQPLMETLLDTHFQSSFGTLRCAIFSGGPIIFRASDPPAGESVLFPRPLPGSRPFLICPPECRRPFCFPTFFFPTAFFVFPISADVRRPRDPF